MRPVPHRVRVRSAGPLSRPGRKVDAVWTRRPFLRCVPPRGELFGASAGERESGKFPGGASAPAGPTGRLSDHHAPRHVTIPVQDPLPQPRHRRAPTPTRPGPQRRSRGVVGSPSFLRGAPAPRFLRRPHRPAAGGADARALHRLQRPSGRRPGVSARSGGRRGSTAEGRVARLALLRSQSAGVSFTVPSSAAGGCGSWPGHSGTVQSRILPSTVPTISRCWSARNATDIGVTGWPCARRVCRSRTSPVAVSSVSTSPVR